MPKFEKGSQEAKDYMASLREKRMSGGKIQPEGEGVMTDIVSKIKKTAKKTRRIINKTAESVKTIAEGGRGDYPPKVRKLLSSNGDKTIVSAIINRKPVEKKLTGLLNVLSLGQFQKNIANEPYDDLFHLSIVLRAEDGKNIMIEKNEVINMSMTGRSGGENLPVTPFKSGKTLNEIMENTKKRMGDNFYSYSARNNNCQDFILALLQSNGMGDANDFAFVKQDAKQMFKGLKTLSKVADFITDLGGATNVLISGTGGRSSKVEILPAQEQPMEAVMKRKNSKKIVPVKDRPITLIPDKTKWAKHIKGLTESLNEINDKMFEIGRVPSEKKEYERLAVIGEILQQELSAYEGEQRKTQMKGKGAKPSKSKVAPMPEPDRALFPVFEKEVIKELSEASGNTEKQIRDEIYIFNEMNSALLRDKSIIELFAIEQMKRDNIHWKTYLTSNRKGFEASRPMFKGPYHNKLKNIAKTTMKGRGARASRASRQVAPLPSFYNANEDDTMREETPELMEELYPIFGTALIKELSETFNSTPQIIKEIIDELSALLRSNENILERFAIEQMEQTDYKWEDNTIGRGDNARFSNSRPAFRGDIYNVIKDWVRVNV